MSTGGDEVFGVVAEFDADPAVGAANTLKTSLDSVDASAAKMQDGLDKAATEAAKSMQAPTAALGGVAAAATTAAAAQTQTAKASQGSTDALDRQAQILKLIKGPADEYAKSLAAIKALEDAGSISADQAGIAIEKLGQKRQRGALGFKDDIRDQQDAAQKSLFAINVLQQAAGDLPGPFKVATNALGAFQATAATGFGPIAAGVVILGGLSSALDGVFGNATEKLKAAQAAAAAAQAQLAATNASISGSLGEHTTVNASASPLDLLGPAKALAAQAQQDEKERADAANKTRAVILSEAQAYATLTDQLNQNKTLSRDNASDAPAREALELVKQNVDAQRDLSKWIVQNAAMGTAYIQQHITDLKDQIVVETGVAKVLIDQQTNAQALVDQQKIVNQLKATALANGDTELAQLAAKKQLEIDQAQPETGSSLAATRLDQEAAATARLQALKYEIYDLDATGHKAEADAARAELDATQKQITASTPLGALVQQLNSAKTQATQEQQLLNQAVATGQITQAQYNAELAKLAQVPGMLSPEKALVASLTTTYDNLSLAKKTAANAYSDAKKSGGTSAEDVALLAELAKQARDTSKAFSDFSSGGGGISKMQQYITGLTAPTVELANDTKYLTKAYADGKVTFDVYEAETQRITKAYADLDKSTKDLGVSTSVFHTTIGLALDPQQASLTGASYERMIATLDKLETPLQKYREGMAQLVLDNIQGAYTTDQFAAAEANLNKELAASTAKTESKSTEALVEDMKLKMKDLDDTLKKGIDKSISEHEEAAKRIQDAYKTAFDGIGSELKKITDTGKIDFSDVLRIALQVVQTAAGSSSGLGILAGGALSYLGKNAEGGQYIIGGGTATDSTVMMAHVSRGERVTIEPESQWRAGARSSGGGSGGGGTIVQNVYDQSMVTTTMNSRRDGRKSVLNHLRVSRGAVNAATRR